MKQFTVGTKYVCPNVGVVVCTDINEWDNETFSGVLIEPYTSKDEIGCFSMDWDKESFEEFVIPKTCYYPIQRVCIVD